MIQVVLRLHDYVELKNGENLTVRMKRTIQMPAAPFFGMRIRLVNSFFATLYVTIIPEDTVIEWDNARQEYVVYLSHVGCLEPGLESSELKLFGFEDAA